MNGQKKKSSESRKTLLPQLRNFCKRKKQRIKKIGTFDKKYRGPLIRIVIVIALLIVPMLFYLNDFSYSYNGRIHLRLYQWPWSKRILVLDHSESILLNEANHRILPPGPAYDYLPLDVIGKTDLKEYSAILISSHYFDFENDYDPNCISKINDYVRNGGTLIVLLHYNYDWLEKPIKFEKRHITSVALGDLNHPYFEEVGKNPEYKLQLIHRIENNKGIQVGDGFLYPAYGVFSDHLEDALILDEASQEPILVATEFGSGKLFLAACPWDYHFYRTDVPEEFAFTEADLFYHAILWALSRKDTTPTLPPFEIKLTEGAFRDFLMFLGLSCFITQILLKPNFDKYPLLCKLRKAAPIFILLILPFTGLLITLLHAEMNNYYDRVYQNDRDFDGFPDQNESIVEADGLISHLRKAQRNHYGYSVLIFLFIISGIFGITPKLPQNPFQEYSQWPDVVVIITLTLVFMILRLIIFALDIL